MHELWARHIDDCREDRREEDDAFRVRDVHEEAAHEEAPGFLVPVLSSNTCG
jgi:hypothetical protein